MAELEQEPPGFVPVGHPPGVTVTPTPTDTESVFVSDPLGAGFVDVPKKTPTIGETTGAAFRLENSIVGAVESLTRDQDYGEDEPDHNPLDLISGTEVEPYWQHFLGSKNAKETEAIKGRIQKELDDRKIIGNSGASGLAMSMVAGFLDWPTLIPVPAVVGAVRAGKAGVSAAKSAAKVGGAAGAAVAAQEALLHSQQYTRTLEESAIAVGGTIVLGGLLGGTLSSLNSRQFTRLAQRLEAEMRVPDNPADDVFGVGGLRMAQAAGAKAANDLPDVELQGSLGVARALQFQDPTLRLLHNDLRAAREANVQLSETVLGLTRNMEGVTTAPTGGAVETRIKTQWQSKLAEALQKVDAQFSEYRFGKPVKMAAGRAQVESLLGRSPKMTYKEFKEAVGQAMARNDDHAVPEVAKAAKEMRKFIDYGAEQAIKYKLLDPEVVAKGKPSSGGAAPPGGGPGPAGPAPKGPAGPKGPAPAAAPTPEQVAQRAAMAALVDAVDKALGTNIDPVIKAAIVEALMASDGALAKQLQELLQQLLDNQAAAAKAVAEAEGAGKVRPGTPTATVGGEGETLTGRALLDHVKGRAAYYLKLQEKDASLYHLAYDNGKLKNDFTELAQAEAQLKRDQKLARDLNQQEGGVDDASKPDAGRPWTGIIDGTKSLLKSLIDRVEGRPAAKAKLDEARARVNTPTATVGGEGAPAAKLSFADEVNSAARSTKTEGLHGSVFIEDVWKAWQKQSPDNAKVSLEEFQQRLKPEVIEGRVEAYIANVMEEKWRDIHKRSTFDDGIRKWSVIKVKEGANAGEPPAGGPDIQAAIQRALEADSKSQAEAAEWAKRKPGATADASQAAHAQAVQARDALAQIVGEERANALINLARDNLMNSALRDRLTQILDDLTKAAQKASEAPQPEAPKSGAGMGEPPPFDPKIADDVWDDGAQSYITRIYNREKIKAQYGRFKGILIDYFANAQQRAGVVLSRLQAEAANAPQPEAGAKADAGAAAAAKNIADLQEFVSLSRGDLDFIAQQVISHILGHPDGRMTFDLPPGVRGPLKARTLRIRDELIEDFLERDIGLIGRYYARTMGPDVELTRMFGSLDMKDAINRIADEADQLAMSAADEKARTRILNAKETAIRDLTAIADRIRGTYAVPEDPTAFLPRFGHTVRTLNYLRLLGGMTVSAFPDIFRPLMVHGITTYFRDGWLPLVRNLSGVKLAGNEVKMAGTALDMILDTRAMSLADMLDDYGRHSKFQRALGNAQQNFGIISLMAPWNAMMKQWVGMMTMTQILRAAEAVAKGTIGKKALGTLAAESIDEGHARIIADQFARHGKIEGGVYLPNTQAWDVANPNVRNALEAFRGAVARDVDRIIVTPGQDKPLWMSTEVGKIVGQVKSFAVATIQRTLIAGLQQRDAGVISGMVAMVAMGAVVEYLRSLQNDRPLPTTPAQWAATAIDRSGLTGYLYDVNHFAEQMTGGAIGIARLTGKPISRYASRNWADAILGPTAGLLKDTAGATSGLSRAIAFDEPVAESDIRALRRILPYQNLFYASWLFRQLEKSAAQAVGAKPTRQRH